MYCQVHREAPKNLLGYHGTYNTLGQQNRIQVRSRLGRAMKKPQVSQGVKSLTQFAPVHQHAKKNVLLPCVNCFFSVVSTLLCRDETTTDKSCKKVTSICMPKSKTSPHLLTPRSSNQLGSKVFRSKGFHQS